MMNTVVAAIIWATLVRIELILMVLGSSHRVNTHRAVLPSAHGSCFPASAAMAKTNCEERGGVLFSIDDLKMAHALRIMELAIQDLGDIWMFTNGASTLERNLNVTETCLTDVLNDSSCPKGVNCGDLHGCCKSTVTDSTGVNAFTTISCEELRHYVCKINSTGQDFRGNNTFPCATTMSLTTTLTFYSTPFDGRRSCAYTGVVTNRNIRDPFLYFARIRTKEMYIPCMNDTSSSIPAIAIIIGVVVTVVVVVGFITCCCCVIKCATKPIKYAVRVQSALYHKNNPEPEVAGGPHTKPEDMLATHVVNLNNT